MVPLTRRRLLHGASALAIGLAGCSGTSSSGRSSSNLPTDAENVELDPDVVALRNTEDEQTAWIGQRPTETRTPTEREPRITDREAGLIASADRAAKLSFGDVNGRTEARSFVEATDFETETLLLETRRVAECYTLECCAVTWSTDDYTNGEKYLND